MKKIKKEKTIVDKVETIESDDTQEKNKNKSFNIIEVIVIMIITLLFGAFVGSSVTYFREKNGLLTGNKYLKELISTYYDVANNYYGDINSEELLESGIKGMIDYLNDPYSNYLSPSTSAKLNENLEGKYVGLGAEVIQNDDNNLVIKKIYEGSPAEKSGLKLNDVIYKVDDTLVNTLTLEEVTSIIKGKEGTTSLLGVKRGSEELQLKFVREKVDIYSVTGEVIEKDNKKLGLIKISVFAKNSYEQFEKTYNNLFKEGISSLIIDVRDNNGGYLSVVKDISEMFLNKNDTVFIVEDNDGKVVQKASKKAIINIIY